MSPRTTPPAGTFLAPPTPGEPRLPERVGVFGMALTLASFGMLFAASMLGYVLIRVANLPRTLSPDQLPADPILAQELQHQAARGVPWGLIQVPWLLGISTLLIIASSVTMHRALTDVRRERQAAFRRMLHGTLALSGLFVLVQVPGLYQLVSDNADRFASDQRLHIFIFALIVIHALHVIGGLIPLAIITRCAHRGDYDHEWHTPVRLVTIYWHFLDAVWLVMLGLFLLDPILA